MAKKTKKQRDDDDGENLQGPSLARFLSQKARFEKASPWLIGMTPLVCHSWSEKARREMLSKQTRATRPGKEPRDPGAEFEASLYRFGEKGYGFPATAIKKCLLSAAHKDKGIARDTVMRSLWIEAPFVRVTAVAPGAICDLPLVQVWGSEPIPREDMVRVGVGLNKIANLTWRAQFSIWAIKARIRYNASVLSADVIADLINESGQSCGIGDWRNEKSGSFGLFRLATAEEAGAWDAYAAGKGPLPETYDYLQAAE